MKILRPCAGMDPFKLYVPHRLSYTRLFTEILLVSQKVCYFSMNKILFLCVCLIKRLN